MSNLSDKEIDRLSREAAEFYEPDDSMMSWSKLEQQLTEHIPERPPDLRSPFRMQPLVWGPAVLLLTGITYFIVKNTTYRKHSTLKGQTEKLTSLPSVKVAPNGSGTPAENSKTTSAQENNASKTAAAVRSTHSKTDGSTASTINANSPGASSKDISANAPASKTSETGNSRNHLNKNNNGIKTGDKNSIAIESATGGTKDKSAAHGGKHYLGSSAKNVRQTNSSETNGSLPKNTVAAPGSAHKTKTQRDNSKYLSAEESVLSQTESRNIQQDLSASLVSGPSGIIAANRKAHAFELPSLIVSTDHPVVSGNDSSLNRFAGLKESQKPPEAKTLQINRSLVFGMLMGPDYTNAGGMANDQLSNNLGISIGYYLTSRLSVNTGISLTTKYYWTEGKQFQPQSPQPVFGITAAASFPHIEWVNGSCDIYEIPLTMRYDFYQNGKYRLFVNGGLSTYLLRSQEYNYFFHDAGRSYEYQNENDTHINYWFAIGNLSAGIEHDLGKGFSFQFEPFIRIPFRDIGAGNVKLNSYGMLFSLRFTPVLGRTRK
jgi:hypothetical protein